MCSRIWTGSRLGWSGRRCSWRLSSSLAALRRSRFQRISAVPRFGGYGLPVILNPLQSPRRTLNGTYRSQLSARRTVLPDLDAGQGTDGPAADLRPGHGGRRRELCLWLWPGRVETGTARAGCVSAVLLDVRRDLRD